MTIDEKRSWDGSSEVRLQALKLQGVDDSCERMMTVEGKLPGQDSNLDKENQNLLCYRYTTG